MKTPILVGVALCAALSLAACTANVTRTGLAITLASRIYCVGVTEEGKQLVRDALTGGLQLVACPPGTVQTRTPPPPAADAPAAPLSDVAPEAGQGL